MSNFNTIITEYKNNADFAGTKKDTKIADIENKRKLLLEALSIRKKECVSRYTASIIILIIILLLLIYLLCFQKNGLDSYKEIMGSLGGGSLIGLLTYIISLRDELTKIRQTVAIASQVDGRILDSILLAIPVK